MNLTAPSMPKVMYRCSKQLNCESVNSTCLIDSMYNPVDALRKHNTKNHSYNLSRQINKTSHAYKYLCLNKDCIKTANLFPNVYYRLTMTLLKLLWNPFILLRTEIFMLLQYLHHHHRNQFLVHSCAHNNFIRTNWH